MVQVPDITFVELLSHCALQELSDCIFFCFGMVTSDVTIYIENLFFSANIKRNFWSFRMILKFKSLVTKPGKSSFAEKNVKQFNCESGVANHSCS